jgi:hypothetical protein
MALSAEKLDSLLQRKGIDAAVRIYPDAVFDPAKNKTTLGDPIEYSVKVIPPYDQEERYGKTVLMTSGKGMTGIANKDLNFEIKTGLILMIYNREWTVTGFIPLSNKSGVLFYLLEIET